MDPAWCLVPKTERGLVVTKVEVVTANANYDIAGDLIYAANFQGKVSPVTINSISTSYGKLTDSTITTGSVPSGKAIYLLLSADPSSSLSQFCIDITYHY